MRFAFHCFLKEIVAFRLQIEHIFKYPPPHTHTHSHIQFVWCVHWPDVAEISSLFEGNAMREFKLRNENNAQGEDTTFPR